MTTSILDSEFIETGRWCLVGRLPGESQLQRISIPSSGATVGRSSGAVDVVLPSSYVSNRHARLVPCETGVEVHDLGSRNGTYLRCQKVNGVQLAASGDTVAFADVEFRLQLEGSEDSAAQKSFETLVGKEHFEAEWTLSNFARLVDDRLVTPVMQPVVELRSRRMIGLEALARSDVSGLETPAKMFEAAELLNQGAVLSEICREKAIDVVRGAFRGQRLFLNTHPQECLGEDLLRSVQECRRRLPSSRLVIEVQEERIDELATTRSFTRKLAKLGVEFALDDFGAGKSRINEVLRLRPDFVKFDRSLIGNIDHSPAAEQKTIKGLVDLLKSLAIRCVAEGIERREEADVCMRLGFELAQGFLFARPMRFEQLCLMERSLSAGAAQGHRGAQTQEYPIVTDE